MYPFSSLADLFEVVNEVGSFRNIPPNQDLIPAKQKIQKQSE